MKAQDFDYVGICNHPACVMVIRNADERKARSLSSHHAWSHHHSVVIYRRDLTPIGEIDHEGISAQPALF